jgi:hypothetical protein
MEGGSAEGFSPSVSIGPPCWSTARMCSTSIVLLSTPELVIAQYAGAALSGNRTL